MDLVMILLWKYVMIELTPSYNYILSLWNTIKISQGMFCEASEGNLNGLPMNLSECLSECSLRVKVVRCAPVSDTLELR